MKLKSMLGLLICLGVWGAGAAESNAVAVDLQSDAVRYLDSGTLSFPIDWDGGLVPANVTTATLSVKGSHYSASATVVKPAATIACTLFETPPVPFRADTLTATLVFSSADGKLAETNSTTYELRAATFGRGRVLTCATTANAWRLYQPPQDIPYDTKWFPELQGDGLSWAAISNLVTGVYTAPLAPFTGALSTRGFIPLEKASFPAGKYYLRMWHLSEKKAEAWLDGVNGVLVIIR